MTDVNPFVVRVPRRRPLAAGVASILALSAPASAIADNWTVNDCNEGSSGNLGMKTGTLRFALDNATSPATINLTGLTGMAACPSSKISLTTGALKFNQEFVTINGPGSSALKIDASGLTAGPTYNGNPYGYQRVFSHYGNGKLKIQSLGVTGGHAYRGSMGYSARGGCILSNGAVELVSSLVTNCYAKHANGTLAAGGAVYAAGAFTMNASTVSFSYARSDTAYAYGGGVFAGDDITMASISIVQNNEVKSASSKARGGGLFGKGDATISSVSYVSANKATSTTSLAKGGGLYTVANTSLSGGSGIKYNSATSPLGNTSGGGAHVSGNLTLEKSRLFANSATSTGFRSVGGGAFVAGDFSSAFSTISGNSASGGTFTGGGALYLNGNATLTNTTASGNSTNRGYAGIDVFSNAAASKTFFMSNSTISGNTAGTGVGGLYVNSGTVKIYNSTIAFNTDDDGIPGLFLSASNAAMAVTLQSTLISNNTFGSNENDLGASNPGDITFNAGPANNLIRATGVTGLPADTLFVVCPLLGPLRDNGGLTKTHTLTSTSAAIDHGNALGLDPGTMMPFVYDQRGSAADNGELDYLRVSGPLGGMNPKADIGAHEVQQDDVIFDTGLEGCIELI